MNTLSLPDEKVRKGQRLRCHPRDNGDPGEAERQRMAIGNIYWSLEILGTRLRMTVVVASMRTRETRKLADES